MCTGRQRQPLAANADLQQLRHLREVASGRKELNLAANADLLQLAATTDH